MSRVKGGRKMEFENLKLRRFTITVDSEGSPGFKFYDLHHGLLVSRNIIPHEWTIKEPRMTPVFSELAFDNGVVLFMDDDTFQVSQTKNLEFGGKAEPPELVVKVLLATDRDVPGEVYIGWLMSIPCEDSRSWLLDRFICSGIILDSWVNPDGRIRFILGLDDLEIIIDLSSDQSRKDDGVQSDDIDVFCGVRHESFADGSELTRWLSEWRRHEQIMLGVLKSLLGVEND